MSSPEERGCLRDTHAPVPPGPAHAHNDAADAQGTMEWGLATAFMDELCYRSAGTVWLLWVRTTTNPVPGLPEENISPDDHDTETHPTGVRREGAADNNGCLSIPGAANSRQYCR